MKCANKEFTAVIIILIIILCVVSCDIVNDISLCYPWYLPLKEESSIGIPCISKTDVEFK